MSGRIIPTILWAGRRFPRNWATAHFWPFMVSLGTVMALVGVSFSMLIYYNERIMRLKVYWKSKSSAILDLVGSNQFILYPQ